MRSKVQFNGTLRDKDNLSTKDKCPAPNVSVIRRFHCISVRILLLFINNAKFTSINRRDTPKIVDYTNHIRGALGHHIELEKCI